MSLQPGTHQNTTKAKMDPFKDLEQIHQQWSNTISDDETVQRGKQYTSTCIQDMVTMIATEKICRSAAISNKRIDGSFTQQTTYHQICKVE